MSLQDKLTVAIAPPRTWPQVRLGGWLGYALIWAFFGLFLIYPLIRLFYDTFTTDQGYFTLMNFSGFFTDSFYLKCLVKSAVLWRGDRGDHLDPWNRDCLSPHPV